MLLSIRLGKHKSLQSAADNKVPLMEGQTGPGIAAVQGLLADLGFTFDISFRKSKFDGIFGKETKANVQAFQAKFGLKADGIGGAMTMKKLDDLIMENNILEEHDAVPSDFRDARDHALPIHQRTRFVT